MNFNLVQDKFHRFVYLLKRHPHIFHLQPLYPKVHNPLKFHTPAPPEPITKTSQEGKFVSLSILDKSSKA